MSLTRPELFQVQLRALLRAAPYGQLRILFPFVSGVEQLRADIGAAGAGIAPGDNKASVRQGGDDPPGITASLASGIGNHRFVAQQAVMDNAIGERHDLAIYR